MSKLEFEAHPPRSYPKHHCPSCDNHRGLLIGFLEPIVVTPPTGGYSSGNDLQHLMRLPLAYFSKPISLSFPPSVSELQVYSSSLGNLILPQGLCICCSLCLLQVLFTFCPLKSQIKHPFFLQVSPIPLHTSPSLGQVYSLYTHATMFFFYLHG